MDLTELFADAAAPDPARPFLTFYDDAAAERTELSYLTIDNWVSKTANLLVDEVGLGPGDSAHVRMPAHWLTAAVTLGCWRAGLAVAHEPSEVDVVFASEDRLDQAVGDDTVYAVATAPLSTRLRTPEAVSAAAGGEIEDYLVEVRGHGDHFSPPARIDPASPALIAMPGGSPDLTRRQVVDAAKQRAAELGLAQGERILLAGDVLPPLDWLLAPLAVQGSTVLCRNSADVDLSARARQERARVVS